MSALRAPTVICMSLYYEDVVSRGTEKNNNLYGTVRTMPKCKFDSCPFDANTGVWCPLKDLEQRDE